MYATIDHAFTMPPAIPPAPPAMFLEAFVIALRCHFEQPNTGPAAVDMVVRMNRIAAAIPGDVLATAAVASAGAAVIAAFDTFLETINAKAK